MIAAVLGIKYVIGSGLVELLLKHYAGYKRLRVDIKPFMEMVEEEFDGDMEALIGKTVRYDLADWGPVITTIILNDRQLCLHCTCTWCHPDDACPKHGYDIWKFEQGR